MNKQEFDQKYGISTTGVYVKDNYYSDKLKQLRELAGKTPPMSIEELQQKWGEAFAPEGSVIPHNNTIAPKARRYNNGKPRYELIPANALRDVADVYTKGAAKYTIFNDKGEIVDDGANNWRKGLSWTAMIGSVQRHIEAWKNGEDMDPDLGTKHLANAAWGLLGLLEYYRIHPGLDDRQHAYLNLPKIGLDIDGVLADFTGHLFRVNGIENHESMHWNDPVVRNLFEKVKHDTEFWLNIPPLIKPTDLGFEPHCYITARSIGPEICQQWLDKHGFPTAKIHCVGDTDSKVKVAREAGIDLFIDDHYNNFVELNKAGVCTLLYTASYNREYKVGHKRINNFKELQERYL